MADTKIKIDLIVDDKGTVKVRQFGKNVDKLSTDTGTMGEKMAAAAAGVGRLTTAVAGAAIKVGALSVAMVGLALGKGITTALTKFSEFEVALLKMGNVTSDSLEDIRAQIVALPAELGTSTELMQGYYQVMSAGITESSAALDMLTTAAKASKEAELEMGDVVKGLSALMSTYGDDIKTASDAADLLYQMEAKGILQVQEMIPYIGNLANVSQAAGLSANEMGAALAQVSTAGQGTSIAVTQLQSLVAALSKKFDQLPESIQKYGSAAEAVKAIGFEGVLKAIWESTEGNSSALIKLLGRQEAYMALLQLSKGEFGEYVEKFDQMKEKTGSFEDAWARFSGTLRSTFETFKNVITNQMILIGEKFAPVVKNLLQDLTAWIEANQDIIQSKIAEYVGQLGNALNELGPKVREFVENIDTNLIPVLQALGNVIKYTSEVFYTIGSLFGWFAAEAVKATESVKGFMEFVSSLGNPIDFLMRFYGEGSTILPLTEKVAEMTQKMAGFSANVNNLETKAVVNFVGNVNGTEKSLSEAVAAAEDVVSRISSSSSKRAGGAGPDFSAGAEGYKEMSDLYYEAVNHATDPWVRSFYRKMGQLFLEKYQLASQGQEVPELMYFETGTGTRGLPMTGQYTGHEGEIVLNKKESDFLRAGGAISAGGSKGHSYIRNYHITISPQFMSGDRAAAANVAKEIKRELIKLDHRWAT